MTPAVQADGSILLSRQLRGSVLYGAVEVALLSFREPFKRINQHMGWGRLEYDLWHARAGRALNMVTRRGALHLWTGPPATRDVIARLLAIRGAAGPGLTCFQPTPWSLRETGNAGPLADLAAIGLVNGAWRNTCVENWHAEGRLRDGDMLRVNSHTTWRVRQLMRRWMRETGLDAAAPASALDDLTADAVWWLVRRLYQWLASPSRRLPTGVTLAQLAGAGLTEYENDADECLSTFAAQAEDRGARFGFLPTAAHGGLACSHWWGHPHWPAQVEQFMKALGNPADDHWGPSGEYKARLPAEPADVADRARLRRLLLSRPWELSTDTAQWLVRAGIRYARA